MKILHTVEFYSPSVGGMQEVVRQISEHLVKSGHDVTVATSHLPTRCELQLNGVRIEEFTVSGNMVRGIYGDVKRYREFVLSGGFDVVTCFAAQQWATDALLPILAQIRAVKVFVPTGFSGLHLPEYKSYFEAMKFWLNEFDMNVFLSEDYRDINFALKNDAKNITIIPNGASEDEFLPLPTVDIRKIMGIPHDHMLLLHVGSHTGLKGHSEAMRIFSKTRIRNATFLLVANKFGEGCASKCLMTCILFNLAPARLLDGKRILLRSLSREDTIAAYHEADIFLFPSNIECSPLVLFECLASKTPFLSTDVGNAREIVSWSGGGRVLPTYYDKRGYARADVTASARLLENVVADIAGRKNMADCGVVAWRDRFTWGKISHRYESLYTQILNSKTNEVPVQ